MRQSRPTRSPPSRGVRASHPRSPAQLPPMSAYAAVAAQEDESEDFDTDGFAPLPRLASGTSRSFTPPHGVVPRFDSLASHEVNHGLRGPSARSSASCRDLGSSTLIPPPLSPLSGHC